MKSIMISIKPEWVAKILNGDKTIEIRKTSPKCELPCKVYIYCTRSFKSLRRYDDSAEYGKYRNKFYITDHNKHSLIPTDIWNGKVVAEFTLNKVEQFDSAYSEWVYSVAPEGSKMPMNETQFIQISEQKGKLDCNDLLKYFGDEDYIAYMWHIDDLKIYGEPKLLQEFFKPCEGCDKLGTDRCTEEISYCKAKVLRRPPQSWCYVEMCDLEMSFRHPSMYSTNCYTGKAIDKLSTLEDVLEEFGIESAEELRTHLLFKENMTIWENKFALQNEIKELKSQLSKAIVPKFTIGQEVFGQGWDGQLRKGRIFEIQTNQINYDKHPLITYLVDYYGNYSDDELDDDYFEEKDIFTTEAEAQAKLDVIRRK